MTEGDLVRQRIQDLVGRGIPYDVAVEKVLKGEVPVVPVAPSHAKATRHKWRKKGKNYVKPCDACKGNGCPVCHGQGEIRLTPAQQKAQLDAVRWGYKDKPDWEE
jgi:hypothetical protein